MSKKPQTGVSALRYYHAAHKSMLVDSLPSLNFGTKAKERLSFLPPTPDDEVRQQGCRDRLEFLDELDRVHIALNRDLDLAETVHAMIRKGYKKRGSVADQRRNAHSNSDRLVNKASAAMNSADALKKLIHRAAGSHSSNDTRALIGIPASGKTRAIHQIVGQYPSCIRFAADKDPRLPAVIIPALIIETPADGTIPSLHTEVVRAVSFIVGGNVVPLKNRPNRTEYIKGIADIVQHYHVGIIIIDEIQKLTKKRGTADYLLLNFMLELANSLEVPVLFVGTPASQKLQAEELRNARRMLGKPWLNFPESSNEWDGLVKGIWKYQFTAEFAPLTDNLKESLHHETVGLPGLLVPLLRETQRSLILANLRESRRRKDIPEIITSNLIKSVAVAIFAPIKPMLEALRSGDPDALQIFEDLSTSDSLMSERAAEIAEIRKQEFFRTTRAIRAQGTKQRRSLRYQAKLKADAVLDGMAEATNLNSCLGNPKSEKSDSKG